MQRVRLVSLEDVLNTPTVALALRIQLQALFHWTMLVILPCAFSCRPWLLDDVLNTRTVALARTVAIEK